METSVFLYLFTLFCIDYKFYLVLLKLIYFTFHKKTIIVQNLDLYIYTRFTVNDRQIFLRQDTLCTCFLSPMEYLVKFEDP